MQFNTQPDWDTGAPRRILGMKVWQVALLGGMAVLDCLVLVIGAVIILGAPLSGPGGGLAAGALATATPVVPTPGATLAPTPSITPITMAFQFPTYTPYGTPAETFTPSPSVTALMEGWVKFSQPTIEIWMPGTFAAGNPKTETDAIIASLKEKGANFNWDVIKKQLESVSANYVMWAIDSHQGNPDYITNMFVAYFPPNPGEPLADYARRFVGEMSDTFILIEQANTRHPDYDVLRTVLEDKADTGTKARIVLYVMRVDDVLWNILCFTAADEASERLPVFDRMVESFRVLQAP